MAWLRKLNAYNRGLMSAEAEGGSGGADAGSIMFPGDVADSGAGDTQPGGEGDSTKAGGDQGESEKAEGWKEYENDPAKTDEENAAAKAEHDKAKPGEEDKGDLVPEDGKYDLKMPDGVELDGELADALMPEFKAAGLTGKQAQALVDKFIETQQGRGAKQSEAWGQTVQGWADSAKADAEIGGTRWDDTVKTAVGFMGKFTTEAGRDYLNSTGAGNHPEMIRMARNAGKELSRLEAENADLRKQLSGEDNPAIGGAGGSSKPADAANILFPTEAKG